MNPPSGSRPYPSGPASQPASASPFRTGSSARSSARRLEAGAGRRWRRGRGAGGGAGVDPKLVRRMKAGDEDALGEFYDRWFPVVNCLGDANAQIADRRRGRRRGNVLAGVATRPNGSILNEERCKRGC